MSEVISKIPDKLELPEEELGYDKFIGHTLLVKIGSLNYCVMLIYLVLEIFDNNINSAKFITAGFFDIINFRSYVIQNFLRLPSEVIITCLVFFGFRSKFTIDFGINFIIKFIIDSVKLRSESRINI